MKMNDLPSYDPLDVRAVRNPSLPHHPVVFDAWPHIGKTAFIDPRRIRPMNGQPREDFKRISRLARGIKHSGQETTIHVFPIDDPDYDVELVAGERRTKACLEARIAVRAEIRPPPTDEKEQYVSAVVENFNREDLTLVETVKMVARLGRDGHSQDAIAEMAGKTTAWVEQFVRLASLDVAVLKLLDIETEGIRGESGRKLRRSAPLSMSIALEVSKLPSKDQLPFAEMLIEEGVQIESARSMVKHRLREAGIKPARRRSARERFDVLGRECHRFEVIIARHLEQTDEELHEIGQGNPKDRVENLVHRLRTLSGELERLARAFDSGVSPGGWHPALQTYFKRELKKELDKEGVPWDDYHWRRTFPRARC